MCWHLAAVQARTSFSIITEKWEAQAALEGDGETKLVLWAHCSSLQETGICQESQQEKLSSLNSPVQAIGSPFFLPPKAYPNIDPEQTAWMEMWSQWGIVCVPTDLCPYWCILWLWETRGAFSGNVSQTSALHEGSATIPLLLQCSSQHRGFSSSIPPRSLLTPGWAECTPSLPGNVF